MRYASDSKAAYVVWYLRPLFRGCVFSLPIEEKLTLARDTPTFHPQNKMLWNKMRNFQPDVSMPMAMTR